MAFMSWSSEIDTGIEVIDNQHKRILDYINDLYVAEQLQSREKISAVIDDLIDYTVSHFAFEESLMEKTGYNFVDAHKKVHKLFIKKINSFVVRHNNEEDVASELLNMLQRWLINHIKNEDFDYAADVKNSTFLMPTEASNESSWMRRSLRKFFG